MGFESPIWIGEIEFGISGFVINFFLISILYDSMLERFTLSLYVIRCEVFQIGKNVNIKNYFQVRIPRVRKCRK